MPEAYIIDAVRSPVGRRGGGLAGIHPADLGAHPIRVLFGRIDVDPGEVDDVIYGCVDTVGGQAGDIARTAWLSAGMPDHVPGVTVDRACGSSQQAVHFAAQAVMSGTSDLVVAGGVQQMSQIPISAAMTVGRQFGFDDPLSGSQGWQERYGTQPVSQFHAAQLIADKWGLTRQAMEEFALRSHERAIAAQDAGYFDREIAPLAGIEVDEGPRRGTSLESMATLAPLTEDSTLTAAVACQIADASAAMLIASEKAVEQYGLTPRARVHHLSVRGADPIWMLTAPIPATERALDKTGMSIDDFAAIEVNEAFAPVVMAWMHETGANPEIVNPNGGAIALGHPLGATGARLMITLLNELERVGGRFGLQTICEAGGQANVTIIERLP